METISYFPNPVPENLEDIRRFIDDELHRIRYWADTQANDFITPDSITVVTGGTPVGTVTDAQTLKDGNVYQVPEVAGTPGFDIEFNFNNVGGIKGFVSMIRYTGSASHDVTLRLHDYVAAADDSFLVIPHTASLDAYRTVLIPDDAKYINNAGQSQMTLYHNTAGNPSHDVYIDYIALIGIRNARY